MGEAKPAKIPKLAENGKTELEKEEALQATIERIDETQSELDSLNEKASEEILQVENKYNKMREPFYKQRSEMIASIKGFWPRVLGNHPQVAAILTPTDEECLQHLTNLFVSEKEDIKSGFKMTFTFDSENNPFFTNKVIEKEVSIEVETGAPVSTATKVDWKPGKNLVELGNDNGDESFFQWFADVIEDGNYGTDELGDIIKDDIWPNPLQYYLATDEDVDEEDDDDGEGPDDEDGDDYENGDNDEN